MGGPRSVTCFTLQHQDKSWCFASQGVAVNTCVLIVLLVITFLRDYYRYIPGGRGAGGCCSAAESTDGTIWKVV